MQKSVHHLPHHNSFYFNCNYGLFHHLIYGRDATLPYDLCFKRPNDKDGKISQENYVANLITTLQKAYKKLNKLKDIYQVNYKKQYYDKTHKSKQDLKLLICV